MPEARHSFTAMTFNVRYDDEWDEAHRWASRRDPVVAAIDAHRPDLLALQEPMPEQWNDIAARLHGMAALTGSAFIRASRFEVGESGVFDVSERGNRTCAWTMLRDRAADRTLIFASTHLDTAAASWLPSARRLRVELDAAAAGAPIVLAGDFNCAAGSDAHRFLLGPGRYRDTWRESGHSDAGVMTYNGFTPLTALPSDVEALDLFLEATSPASGEFTHYQAHVRRWHNYRIDWILIRGALTCDSAIIDTRRGGDGSCPSDHYPVVALLAWQ